MKRILFYEPYGQWHLHVVWETTISHALKLRGANVKHVACNGLFPECGVCRENINPRNSISCLACQRKTSAVYEMMRMPYEWLGNYIPRHAYPDLKEWMHSIPADKLLSASWRGYPVGKWAKSSSHYQFRMSILNLDDPRVQQTVRNYVYGTALSIEGLIPLYDEWQPEILVLLNGRFFSHRAAMELALERNIKVIIHERGRLAGSIAIRENRGIHNLQIYQDIWEQWQKIPLNTDELEKINTTLENRRIGKGHRLGKPFSPSPQDKEKVRRELNLGNRPLIVLFSSSNDETADHPDHSQGAFPNSFDWLPATLALAHKFPHHIFVIRAHPNITTNGINQQALDHLLALRSDLPKNARIVMPADKISSYTLADMAEVGLVYFSTIGLEMAAGGQPIVAVAKGSYGHRGFVKFVEKPAHYEHAIRSAIEQGRQLETARHARRFAYHMWHSLSIPFPLVVEEPRNFGKPKYMSIEDLMPSKDKSLDRICRYILNGEPLMLPSGNEHKKRTEAEEDQFYRKILPELLKDKTTETARAPKTAQYQGGQITKPDKNLASNSGQKASQDAQNPIFSVILATHNRAPILLKCLDALTAQTLPANEFEVLLCDDGSTDDTQAIVKDYSAPYKLHYLRQENSGPATARNMGIRQAKGQYLLFINDDTITNCDLLKAHLQSQQNHHKEKVAILGTFSFLPAHKQQSPFLCFLEEKGLLFRCVKHNTYYNFRYFWTCNISISKKAVIDAGLFDEDFKNAAAEDVELGYRLSKNGYKVFYDENCVAHHDHKISPESFFRKRQVMAAKNALLVAVKHPELAKEMIGLDSLNNNSLTNFKKRTVPSIEKNIETYLQMLTNLDNRPRDYTYDPEVSSKSFLPLFKTLNSYWCAKGIIEGIGQYIKNDKEALQTNNNHKPKISIIVPTYNYAHFIRQCLESILCQTYKNYEVIIMDDNSSDDTENIVQSFLADKRIKYVKNKANLQQPRNCNKALFLAEGQFICFLHADDVFMPQNLEKKLQVLERYPHVAAVFSGVYLIDEKGDIKKELKHKGRPDHDYFGSRDDYHDLMKYNYIPTPSDVLIRKECLERVGGFNEKLINGCDWELWIRLAKNSKLAFIKEPLIGYRLHPANLHSELRRKNDIVVKDHFWIIDSIFNNNNIDAETTKNRDNAYMQIARTISEIPESYRKLYSDALKIRINPSILHNGDLGEIGKLGLSRQLEYAAECQKNEDHIGAVKIYLKLLQSKDADLIAVSYALGMTWMKLLKFPEAASSFNNILENNESYPAAYQHLGKSYHQLNMYDRAETAYRRAIEMLPQDYSMRKHLAELYLEQWKLDAAINELQIYLKLCPNDTNSVRLLEECHSTKHLLSKSQNKTKTKSVAVEKSIDVEKYHTPGKTKVALFRSYFTRPLYKALMSYPEITPVLVDDLEEMRKMLKDLQVDAVVTPKPELIEDTPKSIFSFLINHGLADKNYTSEPRVIKGHNAYLVAGKELRDRALQTGLYDEEHIRLIGYLPFDYLFTETFPDRDKFLEEINLNQSKKTILYAPTWNGLGNYSSLFSHGEQIVKAVPEKYNLIIKYHWNILREVEQKKNGFEQFYLIENYTNKRGNAIILSAGEILKCINACDVLIADTSSVVLEAMCLDKPVIFWDKAERTSLYRIDKQAREAGIIVTSQVELVKAIELSIHNPEHFAESRKKIAAKASLPLDGKCGERAARVVYELLVQNKKVRSLRNKDTHLTELAEHYLKELVVK